MKKAIALLLALFFCMGPALACNEADEHYGTLEQLPKEIQEQVGKEQSLFSACRFGGTICVAQEREGGDVVLNIFREEAERYQVECENILLPSSQGMPFIVHPYSENGVQLECQRMATEDGNGDWLAWFSRQAGDGSWRLANVEGRMGDERSENFGVMHYFADGGVLVEGEGRLLCGQMETDLRLVRFEEIPATMGQAFQRLDMEGYALATSEDAEARLPLYASPDKDSAALGNYCSGAPVKVLEDKGGDWVKVDLAGVEGYMLRESLAFGKDMLDTPKHFYYKLLVAEAEKAGVQVYAEPDSQAKAVGKLDGETNQYRLVFLGMAGNEWFHILFDGDKSGYVETKYFWDGNG